jgi:hypothetical protein
MDCSAAHHETELVVVLCPEPRLDRLLRMALEADGFCVDARPGGIVGRPSPGVMAVVADLDSLGWRLETASAELAAIGFDDTIARVLISVRPPEPNDHLGSNSIYLQPPFSPREFVRRVKSLLDV